MTVTLQQLAYFLAVADVGSFTRAAESLGVAQPTLSRQLRALEDELGAPLVDRGGRDGPTLTAAGEAVLPLARRMLADADGARRTVAEIVGLRRGRVRIGATPSLCIGVLADVLRVFHEQHPDVRLELTESGSQPLVAGLVRGELDIALVIVPPARASTRRWRPNRSCASGCRSPPRRRGRRCPTADRSGCASWPAARWCCPAPATTCAKSRCGPSPTPAAPRGSPCRAARWTRCCGWSRPAPAWRSCRTSCSPAGRGCGAPCSHPPLYRTVALARRADLAPTHATAAFRRDPAGLPRRPLGRRQPGWRRGRTAPPDRRLTALRDPMALPRAASKDENRVGVG